MARAIPALALLAFAAPAFAVTGLDGIRLPERVKANKATINGVSLTPAEKTIENGRKIIAFRTEMTINAIKKAMAAATTSGQ